MDNEISFYILSRYGLSMAKYDDHIEICIEEGDTRATINIPLDVIHSFKQWLNT